MKNKLNRTVLSADQNALTNCTAKLRYKNTLEHTENKTIETYKGANETAKKNANEGAKTDRKE